MREAKDAQDEDCQSVAKLLSETIDFPIFFPDERLLIWPAKEPLFAQGLNEKRMLAKLDQTAAAVFLEDIIAANASHTGKQSTETQHA